MDRGDWWAAVHGVARSRTGLSDFTFTFHLHASEKEMATHSSILAWRIPGKGEPGQLPSMGSHRVGHDWSDLAAAAASQRQTSTTSKYTTFHQDKIKANRFSSPLSGSKQHPQRAPRWRVTGWSVLFTRLGIPMGHKTTEERGRPLWTLRRATACPPVPQINPHPLPQPSALTRPTVEPGLRTATR